MDKKRVIEALETIEKAIEDTDFLEWLDEHEAELEYDFDQYQQSCVKDLEDPETFNLWALRRYVGGIEVG